MTVAIRALLACLVLLPPGTFRTLDAITRKNVCWSDVNDVSSIVKVAHQFRHHSPYPRPAPQRVRNWADVTFLASPEGHRINESVSDVLPGVVITLDLSADRLGQRKSLMTAPPLNAHSTARGLLLAMGELLV